MIYDLNYYLNLITSEHRNKPKYIEWLSSMLRITADGASTTDSFVTAFDIDNAQGVQLDILGQLLGQSRVVTFQPFVGISPVLQDSDYRTLLRAKITKNQWKGTIGELRNLWKSIFPDGEILIRDNQNMTMDVIWISGSFSILMGELIRAGYMTPKPEGVFINYYFGATPFFGWDLQNDTIAGFNTGIWANPYNMLPVFGFDTDDGNVSGFDSGNFVN